MASVGGLFQTKRAMSAIGTKQTCRVALHMSAIGGKADIALGSPATWLLTQVDLGSLPSVTVASPMSVLLHF